MAKKLSKKSAKLIEIFETTATNVWAEGEIGTSPKALERAKKRYVEAKDELEKYMLLLETRSGALSRERQKHTRIW